MSDKLPKPADIPNHPEKRARDTSIHTRKRNPAQKLQDLADISQLFLKGYHQREMVNWIAANRPYTLSIGMINGIVHDAIAHWQNEVTKNIDKLKAADLMRLANIERHAIEAFERSLKPTTKTASATETDEAEPEGPHLTPEALQAAAAEVNAPKTGKKRKVKESRIREERDGDPRWLQVLLDCMAKRIEILGYAKPQKIEVTGEDGGPIQMQATVEAALKLAYGSAVQSPPPAIPVSATVTTTQPAAEPVTDWRQAMEKKV